MGKGGRAQGRTKGNLNPRQDAKLNNRIHKSKKKMQQDKQQQHKKKGGGGGKQQHNQRHQEPGFVKSDNKMAASSSAGAGHSYSAFQKTLLIGEGDFSFAAALALLWQDASNLTATAFDDEASCTAKYRSLVDNVNTIRSLGGTVLFGVDATKAHSHKGVAKRAPFERVIFNFPHVGSGMKDQARNIFSNQALLRGTFASSKEGGLLAPNGRGELHLTLKKGQPYDSWQPVAIAKMCGLVVRHCSPFMPERFPGYAHKRTIGDEHAGGAHQHVANAEIVGARTFAFVPR